VIFLLGVMWFGVLITPARADCHPPLRDGVGGLYGTIAIVPYGYGVMVYVGGKYTRCHLLMGGMDEKNVC